MTIVVAFPFFRQLVIVADSRVSYGENDPHVDDVLQKLYPVGNNKYGFRTVIGFAGPLTGAYQVLEGVKKKARAYGKPAIATPMIEDFVRWIKYEYRMVKEEDRKNLSFLLAGVEPTRDRSISKPSWIPFMPQIRTVTLIPNKKNGTELNQNSTKLIKVIGYRGRKVDNKLRAILHKHFGIQFRNPRMGIQLVIDELILYFMRKQTNLVGGLFQCAVLDVNGVRLFSHSGAGGTLLKIVDGRYVQFDENTGRTVPLMTIHEWGRLNDKQKNQLKGSAGVFEDPIYREIANQLLVERAEDEDEMNEDDD